MIRHVEQSRRDSCEAYTPLIAMPTFFGNRREGNTLIERCVIQREVMWLDVVFQCEVNDVICGKCFLMFFYRFLNKASQDKVLVYRIILGKTKIERALRINSKSIPANVLHRKLGIQGTFYACTPKFQKWEESIEFCMNGFAYTSKSIEGKRRIQSNLYVLNHHNMFRKSQWNIRIYHRILKPSEIEIISPLE